MVAHVSIANRNKLSIRSTSEPAFSLTCPFAHFGGSVVVTASGMELRNAYALGLGLFGLIFIYPLVARVVHDRVVRDLKFRQPPEPGQAITFPGQFLRPRTAEVVTSPSSPKFEGLRECPQGSDALLNECLSLILEGIGRYFAHGLPELDLEPLENIHEDEFEVTITPSIRYKWKNLEIRGGSKLSRNELKVNTKGRTLTFRHKFPLLQIRGEYERNGHFLLVPLTGSGRMNFELINYEQNGTLLLDVVIETNGQPVLKVRDLNLEIGLEDIHSHVPNLANSKDPWSWLANELLDLNDKWIFDQYVKHRMRDRVKEYMILYWQPLLRKLLPVTYFINHWQ